MYIIKLQCTHKLGGTILRVSPIDRHQVDVNTKEYIILTHRSPGPGSVVGIATAYGLDGPGIESRCGEIFRTSPDRP